MTEISLQRLVSVPSALVDEVHEHAVSCPRCRWSQGPLVRHIDTRVCEKAEQYVERAVNYQMAKAHPEGQR